MALPILASCYLNRATRLLLIHSKNTLTRRRNKSINILSNYNYVSIPTRVEERIPSCLRFYSSISSDDVRKRVDSISMKFTDAVELINDAKSSMGTIYFTDDMKDAEQMVDEVFTDYNALLSSLDEKQKTDVQRTIGLKMEELKAQMKIIRDSIKD